jgi:D-alanyl-lipoteichoic acid acyltransferase DltB (MBOAT superfamily)
MSLTFWLTDYVFTPLRMSLRNFGVWGLILSLTATMTLIGVWHGIAPGFVVFGLVHSVYLIFDSLTASGRARFYRRHAFMENLTNIAGPFFVFGMVTFALVFFRAESMVNMQYQMNHLWDGLQSPVSSIREVFYDFGRKRFLLICLATFSMGLWEYLHSKPWLTAIPLPRIPAPLRWAGYYATLVTVVSLHLQSTHFIYVQF